MVVVVVAVVVSDYGESVVVVGQWCWCWMSGGRSGSGGVSTDLGMIPRLLSFSLAGHLCAIGVGLVMGR